MAMRPSFRPAFPFLLVVVLALVGVQPAAAKPATKLAKCDDVPGSTINSSERWRVFWIQRPRRGYVVPLYACKRTREPVRRLVKLSLLYDAFDGSGTVTTFNGDIATFLSAVRYGGSTTYLDLERLRVSRGSSSSSEPPVSDHRLLTPSGALVSFRTRYGPEMPVPDNPFARGHTRVGDLTVEDDAGSRVASPGSIFDDVGWTLLTAVDGPYAVAVPAFGTDAVYFSDGQWRAHRVDLRGAAKSLVWAPDRALTRVRRSFSTPGKRQSRTYPVVETGLQLRETTRDRLSIEWPAGRVGTPAKPMAGLVAGTRRDVSARSHGEAAVVVARFSDDPQHKRLRVFARHTDETLVDRRADSPEIVASLTANVGAISYRDGDNLVLLIREQAATSDAYTEHIVYAPGGSNPVLHGTGIYYTDRDGEPRSFQLTRP